MTSDTGVPGTALVLRGGDIERWTDRSGLEYFRADAGTPWDDLVAASVESDCTDIEMMSGIPGSVGAAPMQNIAAYGQQVSDVIERIDVLDRQSLEELSLSADECEFGFRTSRFKNDWLDRFVVLAVTFRLRSCSEQPPDPSTYVDIVRYFDRNGGSPTNVADRRRAVLTTRSTKSMLFDPDDPNARSVGSFFINPSVPIGLGTELAERLQTMGLSVQYLESRTEQDPDRRRIPAAHVLRFAGFNAGDSWGSVRLSSKHVLALITTPSATATDVWNVGHHIRDRVESETGVRLSFEARFIGTFPEYDQSEFPRRYHYDPAADVEPDWLTSYRTT